MSRAIDVVVDENGKFIEIEIDGHSVEIGQWFLMDDGTSIIRITEEDLKKSLDECCGETVAQTVQRPD